MGDVLPLRPHRDDMTLSETWQMLDAWRDHMVARMRSPDTIEDYEASYFRMLRRTRTSPRSLDEHVIEHFLGSNPGLNHSTRALYLHAAKSIQTFAFKRGYSAVNPRDWDIPVGRAKYPLPDYFRPHEFRAILVEAVRREPEQRYWTIRLMLETGGRIGSIAGVKPGDTGTRVGERMRFIVAKNRGIYDVPLSASAAEAVGELLDLMEPGQETLVGRGSRTIGEWVSQCTSAAGLPKGRRHAHLIRHTAATLFYLRTRDLLMLKDFLGHRDLQTVTRYAAVCDNEMEIALRDGLFDTAWGMRPGGPLGEWEGITA